MKLAEVIKRQHPLSGISPKLQAALREKFGDLSTDEWSVYLEVDQPNTTRTIMGDIQRWIRVWLRCYNKLGDDAVPKAPPTADGTFEVATDLIGKEAYRAFVKLTGRQPRGVTGMQDHVDAVRADYFWDIIL